MKKNYILVIDSGLGGVNILKALKETFVHENFIYVLDNKNCPYGEKTKEELVQIALQIVTKNIFKFNIKLIVFACNTLTSVTIEEVRYFLKKNHLRNICNKDIFGIVKKKSPNYDISVVGTEPPIKMVNPNEKTLICATMQTIKYNKIINENLDNENFDFVALTDIAKMVDSNFYNRKSIIESLKQQIPKKDYKNVVLGCTHYYYLENDIKLALENPKLKFYNATLGVVKRVKVMLKKYENQTGENNLRLKKGKIVILLTKPNRFLKKCAKKILYNDL